MSQIISRENRERREGRERLVAVAVDKDKSSRQALKWTVDNFITRGQTVRLVHVIQRPPLNPNPGPSLHFSIIISLGFNFNRKGTGLYIYI